VLVPEDTLIRVSVPVADAIKYIISLGSITPEFSKSSNLPEVNPSAPAPGTAR
jgi:uncharacterized membrane protein